MANTDNPNGFKCIGSIDGHQPQSVKLLVKSAYANAIAAGDFVILSAGYVQIAAATSGVLLGLATTSVAAAPTADTAINVIIDPDAVYEGQCSGTLTQALILGLADIEGTTGIMEVNEDANTEDVLQILALAPLANNVIGANARAWVKIRRTDCGTLTTAKT